MTEQTADPFASHAIVELMGHVRLAGYCTEATIAGAGFVKVEIPNDDGSLKGTKYCAPGSIYAITPCDEQTARTTANPPPPRYVPGRWAELEAANEDDVDVDDGQEAGYADV